MRHARAALCAALLFLAGCASTSRPEYVRACFESHEGGRTLHDPGVVIDEYTDESGHWFKFQGQYWPHPIAVRKVNRFCPLAAGVSNDFSAANAAPPRKEAP